MELQNNMLSPLNAVSDANDEQKGAALVGFGGTKVSEYLKKQALTFDTLAEAVTCGFLRLGIRVNLKESPSRGGGAWDVVLKSGVTVDNKKVVACTGVATLALVLAEKNPNQWQLGLNTAEELRQSMSDSDTPLRYEYGSRSLINGSSATKGVFEMANFAGQTNYGNEPIGFPLHHYTDGRAVQIDNVGEGNDIVILKNAQNATRRPDKAADFVGNGNFVALEAHNDELDHSERYFFISALAEFVWTGIKGAAVLWQNKVEDGTAAFRKKTTHKHSILSDFVNGLAGAVYRFKNDVGFTRLAIEVDASQTNGLLIETKAGNVALKPAGGKVEVGGVIQAMSGNTELSAPANKMVETKTPLKIRPYSTAALPSASENNGSVVTISDSAGKPSPMVFSNGTIWVYMDNTPV